AKRAGLPRLGDPRNSAKYISFFAGFPDPSSLPKADVIEATRVALERDGEWALQYGAGQGYSGLINELIKKLARDQKIEATPENILITNGAAQAVTLILDMLIEPGDVALSEAPTWSGVVHGLRAAGAEVRSIPVGPEGTDVDALEAELNRLKAEGKRAKLFYMIPNFQNPTGVTTTLERRKRIIELIQEHQVPLIEDDAYFDLRFAGERLPTLYSMDTEGLVMYLGTFSKILAAGVRLGWAVAHPRVIQQLTGLKFEGGTSPFAGHVAAEFCASGTLVEHIEELRKLYLLRRDAMLAALEAGMPEGASWTTPDGGFFIWLSLPTGSSVKELLPKARERGIEFLSGSACYFHGEGDDKIRLSYSFADEAHIKQGIAILCDLVKEQLAAGADA
ncbi:MAG: PLP-dependent aminotransferase family protein, partial [Chloroflexi bacterium]